MTIEIELSLFVNLVINSFILFLTGYFFKEKAKLWFLSSSIGAVIALIIPIFHLSSFALVLVQIFLSILIVSISFQLNSIKNFFSKYSVFLGMTFLFGGGCYAISSTFGSLPLVIVVLICTIIFVVCKLLLLQKNRQNAIDNFSFKVIIKSNGKQIEEEGFLDSGNLLYDPVTKKPVILITFDVFSKLYENINYLSAFLKKIDLSNFSNGHYIKINTVASGTQILVFSANEVKLEGKAFSRTYENFMLGLSFSGFEKAFGKKVLLHSEMV